MVDQTANDTSPTNQRIKLREEAGESQSPIPCWMDDAVPKAQWRTTMQSYNAIDLEVSEEKQIGPQTSDSNNPNIGLGVQCAETFAERAKRAEQIRQDRCGNIPTDVPSGFAKTEAGYCPTESWADVPAPEDDYESRREKLFLGGWECQEVFTSLYNGKFTGYSQIQAESYLAAMFSFTFGKNSDIVAYEMENLPFDTEYSVNPRHRAYIFEVVDDVPSIYCEGIDLTTKTEVAQAVCIDEEVTVSDLDSRVEVGKRQISNILNVLLAEGWVVRETSCRVNEPDIWKDNGITHNYLNGLLDAKKRLEE